jgi:hypothetical protein
MSKDKPDLLVLLGSGATMPHIPGVWQLTTLLREFETRDVLGKDEPRRTSYEFLRSGTYFRPKTFNRISKRLSVSLDGAAWALSDGIEALIERLLMFQKEELSQSRSRMRKRKPNR